MSVVNRSPLRTAQANLFSGGVNTGEFLNARGGVVCASQSGMNSGNAGVSVTILSGGAGRINTVFLHPNPGQPWSQSGIPIQLYDAEAAVSGGAGKTLAFINGPGGVSGQPYQLGKVEVDMPFQSGLFARAASGAPGYSISWTPETNPSVG